MRGKVYTENVSSSTATVTNWKVKNVWKKKIVRSWLCIYHGWSVLIQQVNKQLISSFTGKIDAPESIRWKFDNMMNTADGEQYEFSGTAMCRLTIVSACEAAVSMFWQQCVFNFGDNMIRLKTVVGVDHVQQQWRIPSVIVNFEVQIITVADRSFLNLQGSQL